MSGMVILEGFTLIYKGVFQNFPPAAGSHMVFFRRVCQGDFQIFRLRRPKYFCLGGDSPPQAEIFGILNPLNVGFPMGKRAAGGENLDQIWPQPPPR